MSAFFDDLRSLIAAAWLLVPIPRGQKAPVASKWPDLRITATEVEQHFQQDGNVGVLLGVSCLGLTDIDLDAPEAIRLATEFLPKTGLIHGRPSKPHSHWWYVSRPILTTQQFEDVDGTMLVEYRSTGAQTIIPPSIHPSGERLEWSQHIQPADVASDVLLECVKYLAVATLLARHWPSQGTRHSAALAAAGYLLRRGVAQHTTETIIREAARVAGDEEYEDRAVCARTTSTRLSSDEPATGGRSLGRLLVNDGAGAVRQIGRWVGKAACDLPAIDAGDRDLMGVVPRAWSALQSVNDPPRFFRTHGRLCRLAPPHDGGQISVEPMDRDGLTHELARCARWYKNGRDGERAATPPAYVVRDMLAHQTPPMPPLRGIVRVPSLTPDGVFLTQPGYDPESGLLFQPSADLRMQQLPAQPSRTEVAAARALLCDELLGDFPFVAEADRAHAVALLVLPFVREVIEGPTPLHLIDKPSAGTGATLLLEATVRLSTGEPADVMGEASDDAEWRKRITATLLQDPTYFIIDNVRKRLDSSSLASALTSCQLRDRVLGESRTCLIRNRVVWVATGNNMLLSSEIARRSIRIRLDSGLERPHLRDHAAFRHPDLLPWLRRERSSVVMAVMTLVQAWLSAGRPPYGRRRFGRFEEWATVIGGILGVAEVPGFLENVLEHHQEADEEADALRALVQAWWQEHGDAHVGVAQLVQFVDPLQSGAGDFGGASARSIATKLGTCLQQHRDRVVAGYRIKKAGTRHRAKLWKLIPTPEVVRSDEPSEPSEPLHCGVHNHDLAPSVGLFASSNMGVPGSRGSLGSPDCRIGDRMRDTEPPSAIQASSAPELREGGRGEGLRDRVICASVPCSNVLAHPAVREQLRAAGVSEGEIGTIPFATALAVLKADRRFGMAEALVDIQRIEARM